jgi:hypothetical protein
VDSAYRYVRKIRGSQGEEMTSRFFGANCFQIASYDARVMTKEEKGFERAHWGRNLGTFISVI